jgi:hypothetical protein
LISNSGNQPGAKCIGRLTDPASDPAESDDADGFVT